MKILIADDVEDIRELLRLMVESQFDAEIFEAADGVEAIALLKTKSPFDLVISDYNMPNKNGGHVYLELRQNHPTVPFLLVSTESHTAFPEFKNATLIDSVAKPFDDALLLEKIQALTQSAKTTFRKQPPGYVGISVQVLSRLGTVDYPLFLKLSDSKFVKVLNAHANFNQEEKVRFEGKAVHELYLEKFHYNDFILNFRKKIFSQMAWEEADITDSIELLANDLEMISKASKIFGWSPSVIDLAQENIAKCLDLIDKNPSFKKIISGFRDKTRTRLTTHCTLLAFLMTAVAKELGWISNMTLQKLTFAALLHDLDLDEDLFTSKQTLLNEGDLRDFADSPEGKRIFDHPELAARVLLQWPLCPPDVDKIVLQHHEKLDGTGFPNQLNFQTIFPLAGLFIMSEDIIYHCIDNFGVDPAEYLKSRKEYYNCGEFKKIFNSMLSTLEGT